MEAQACYFSLSVTLFAGMTAAAELRWDLLRDVLIAGDVTKVKVREEQSLTKNKYKKNQYAWARPMDF